MKILILFLCLFLMGCQSAYDRASQELVECARDPLCTEVQKHMIWHRILIESGKAKDHPMKGVDA